MTNTTNNSVGQDSEEIKLGIAGNMAKMFINSPLSPLLLVACFVLGFIGIALTPRQEDPQISVPMFDVFIGYPGASAAQVADSAIAPLERVLLNIQGVKNVYSASERGQGMLTVQFIVGQDVEVSRTKLDAALVEAKLPPGMSKPMVKMKGVDTVPIVTLTLWSEELNDVLLRKIALNVQNKLKAVKDTSDSFITGGRSDRIRVEIQPERLAGYGLSVGQVAQAIQAKNSRAQVGDTEIDGKSFSLSTGEFIKSAEDVKNIQITTPTGQTIYLRDVANVFAGPSEAKNLVRYYTGKAHKKANLLKETKGASAVTIAIAKKKGSNGVTVAENILAKVEELKLSQVITDQIEVAVTRNYGQTAKEKVNALIMKLFIATAIVVFLIWAALNFMWQPAIVVAIVIPVVILVTVFSALIMGYSIDRVSLFALIFSIGILVDDAIVVVENIYRHWLMEGKIDSDVTVRAVAEVGNPTILATFTVIAALLPMGMVSGMMGPYMAPIPALGSVAMLFSVFAAFIFTPWLAMRIRPSMEQLKKMERMEHKQVGMLSRLFKATLTPMLHDRKKEKTFKLAIWLSFAVACSLFYMKFVTVKMLPLDNKPEFNVVVNMTDGTALPVTANVIQALTDEILSDKDVTAVQTYTGTSSPYNFNGLVRHYYLRSRPWQGDIQVQLVHKSLRKDRSSHQIADAIRDKIKAKAEAMGAKIQVVEMPPGPPVLQTIVAEIYGPDAKTRRQVAKDLTNLFEKAESVTDVDNYLTDKRDYLHFETNYKKAEAMGVSPAALTKQLALLMGGYKVGDAKSGRDLEPKYITIGAPLATRAQMNRLMTIGIMNRSGRLIPLGELGQFVKVKEDDVIFRKNLRYVEYVTGEATGSFAAPVYGQTEIKKLLKEANYVTPDNVKLTDGYWLGTPTSDSKTAFEWGGEWTVTFETFRDMGLAFMAAMVLIYGLVVWEFGNFALPAIIMAPIPLTLIGIIPMHGLMGKEFTATSMIGWIALAGIIVRNSILLIDFAKHEIQKGVDKKTAVEQAVITRTRPIMVTALALVGGSLVIYSDPIFNGMAISLMAGVMVSTVLTLYVIPLAAARAHGAYDEEMHEIDLAALAGQGTAEGTTTTKANSGGVLTPIAKVVVFTGFLAKVIGSALWSLWMVLWGGKAPEKSPKVVAQKVSADAIKTEEVKDVVSEEVVVARTVENSTVEGVDITVEEETKDTPKTGTVENESVVSEEEKTVSDGSETIEKSASEVEKDGNSSKKDANTTDLTVIRGIGPKIELNLKDLGCKTIKDIIDLTDSDVSRIETKLGFPGRIAREKWIEQAKDIFAGVLVEPKKVMPEMVKTDVKKSTKKDVALTDITLIKGIGAGVAKKLETVGYTTLQQIAELNEDDIEKIEAILPFKGCIKRENWVEQAKSLIGE